MARPKWLKEMEGFYRSRAVVWVRLAPIKRIHAALGRYLTEAKSSMGVARQPRLRRRMPTKRSAVVTPVKRIPRRANRQLSPKECAEARTVLGPKRGTPEYPSVRDALCLRLVATRRQVGSVFTTPKAAAARVRMQRAAKRSGVAGRKRRSGGRRTPEGPH